MTRMYPLLVLLFVLSTSAFAIPVVLSDSGSNVRTRSTGALLSGGGNLTVEVYDALTSGNLIYNESFSRAIYNGTWNVILGENASNPLNLSFGKAYYRNYLINSEDVNFTRLNGTTTDRLIFHSPLGDVNGTNISADSINATELADNLTLDANLFITNTTGNGVALFINSTSGLIGINTTGPAWPLTVSGIISSLTGGFRFPDGSLQTFASLWSLSGTNTYFTSGNVGINTTSPTEKLEVNGSFKVSNSTDNTVLHVNTSSGNITINTNNQSFALNINGSVQIMNASGGTVLFVNRSSNNVSIGTTNASSKLTVAGTIESSSGGVKFPDGSLQTVAAVDPSVNGFRLTLTSETPVTASNVSSATTIYLSPYKSDRISLYTGSTWELINSSEVSLALGTLVNSTPYDVFAYNNAGVLTLELLAWTSNTTRATSVIRTNGVFLKTGSLTRRLVGTIYTTSTTTTEDSVLNRYVSNVDNDVARQLAKSMGSSSHAYSTATPREYNGGSPAARARFVLSVARPVFAEAQAHVTNGNYGEIMVGLDTTASGLGPWFASQVTDKTIHGSSGISIGQADIGEHYVAIIENGAGGSSTFDQARLYGWVNN